MCFAASCICWRYSTNLFVPCHVTLSVNIMFSLKSHDETKTQHGGDKRTSSGGDAGEQRSSSGVPVMQNIMYIIYKLRLKVML